VQAPSSTSKRIKLALLNGDQMAPNGHANRQNGLLINIEAAIITAKRPIFTQ
jgi:hypothetical protein